MKHGAAPLVAALGLLFTLPCDASSAQEIVSAHRGAVRALIPDVSGKLLLSVGDDGFLVEWDRSKTQAVSRFQLSPYAATALALSPDGEHIAVVETDGLGLYRVSAWELTQRRKLFTLRFRDRVTYLAYSANGSFLIATREAREGVSLIDAESGDLLSTPRDLAGPVSFAATGKSERTMIVYSTIGLLSYWDIATGEEIERVQAPAALISPVLLGNNRYFGGLDGSEFVLIDAVTGREVARDLVPYGAFAVAQSENSSSLFAISVDGTDVSIRELAVPLSEAPRTSARFDVRLPAAAAAVASAGTEIFLALRDGTVAAVDTATGTTTTFLTRRRIRLTDAAVSGKSLLSVSENGRFIFPTDPDDFRENAAFKMIAGQGEDRVLAAGPVGGGRGGLNDEEEPFLLWRSDGSLSPTIYGRRGSLLSLSVPTGVPFRSASVYGSRALFLDTAGAITVGDLATGETEFSFASIGLLDAVLSDERRVLAGKSRAASPNVPLLSIDIVTGETVPIDIDGAAVVRLHRGASGTIHAIVADVDASGPLTSIVRLRFSAEESVASIVEYRAEDVEASIAESSGSIATTLGGDGATLVRSSSIAPFERTDALPARITDGGDRFIVVDSDGGISWHDSETGEAEAVLHVYENRWEMVRNGNRFGGPIF